MDKIIYIADIRSNSNNGKSTGHYIPVAKMYQKIFNQEYDVIVAGGPIYKKYFNESELLHLPYNISSTSVKDKFKTMINCIMLFKEAKGQIIILQQSSVITSFIAILFFYYSTSKLYLIQYSNECFKSKVGSFLYKLIKHKIDGIICPNEKLGNLFGVPYCVVPDYIYTDIKKEKTKKHYDNTKYDFCILGRISPEKGVIECARKFANTKYKVIIAGKPQTEDLENQLKTICSKSANIDLVLDYISENQYNFFLVQSKYALLNYQDAYSERSSGVVFDMLFNDVPVVGSSCKTLQFIRDKKLGYVYDTLSEFNPEIIMNNESYINYLNNISEYRKQHKKFVLKLRKFISTR